MPVLGRCVARLVAGLMLTLTAANAPANVAPVIDRYVASAPQVPPGGFVELRVEAHDPDCASTCNSGCGLYVRGHSWTLTGGTISRSDPQVSGSPYVGTGQWQAPAALGTYTITVTVSDSGAWICGARLTAQASLTVLVTNSPNLRPVVSAVTVSPASLFEGETAALTCVATDPDGDPLAYSWSAESGSVTPGAGGTATFAAGGPGRPLITCTATDPHGAYEQGTTRVSVTGAAAERQLSRGLLAPQRLTVDSQGDVIAVDEAAGSIVAIHAATGEVAWRLPVQGVRCLDADWNDNLLVGGTEGARVVDRRGAPVLDLAPNDGLGDVRDVAVDAPRRRYGVLHGASGRVQVYDETGARIASFGETGDAPQQLRGPAGLAVTPGGDWVVADAGHSVVKVFSSAGALLRSFGSSGSGVGRFSQMDDVEVDGDGVIYVTDTFQAWVQAFRADGVPRETIGTYGTGVGRLQTPAGMAVADDMARLFVASVNSSTVQVFRIEAALPSLTDAPAGALAPTDLSFGLQPVGVASAPLDLAVTNTGSAPLGLRRIAVTPPFAQANACGPFVEPGATCVLHVTFTAEAPQPYAGTLNIDTSAGGAPLVATLAGEGFLPAGLAYEPPQGLDFEDTRVGTISPPRRLMLANTGTVPLAIASVTVVGDYTQSDDCGGVIAGGGTCHVDVRFAPTVVGDHVIGTLVIHSSAPSSPHLVALDGRSVNPSVSVSDVDVAEGDTGTADAVFVLSLSGPSPYEARVDYATAADTATQDADYDGASGTFTFPPGTVTGAVTVRVNADMLLEPEVETFRLVLSSPVNADLQDGAGEARIRDDERCPSPNLSPNGGAESRACDDAVPGWTVVSGTGWSVGAREPAAAEGRLRIAAGMPSTADPAEISQDIDVRAFAAMISTGTQRFAVGAAVRTADEVPSDAARVVVEWRDVDNRYVLDVFDSGEIVSPWSWTRVQDERVAPPDTGWVRVRLLAAWSGAGGNGAYFDDISVSTLRVPTVSVADSEQWEDLAGPRGLELSVVAGCSYWQPIGGVATTEDVTAEAGTDYEPVTTAWELQSGDTRLDVPVAVLPDAVREGHETLAFRLEAAWPADVVVVSAGATGTILDDDACPRSIGWWKTHVEAWPVSCLVLGDDLLPEGALLALLGYGGRDEGMKLGRQLAAAKLNLEAGAPPTVLDAVHEADAFLQQHPLGSSLAPEEEAEARRLTRAVHENSCD